MGKVVRAVVGFALAVVGVFTGNWWLIGMGAALTLSSAIKLPKPTANSATDTRLSKRLEPETFRKIIFGETAGGADLRYWEVFGSEANNFVEVVAVATHDVTAFGNFYLEEELVTFDGSNQAVGKLNGHFSRRTFLKGVSGAGIALGGHGLWTPSASFTGCSYYVLNYLYKQSKFPQGISSRYTQVVKGARVYDPRRDVAYGGTHVITDQSTWEYTPLDSNGQPIGRNNALQMLWYTLGWYINGKLVAGRGANPSDIDLESFIQAANDCELMGWYSDCILSTGDNHDTNEGVLEAASQGILLDTGGRYSYYVAVDDTANVAVTLTSDDIVGDGFDWVPRNPMSQFYNEIAGTFVDPAALYQSRPFPMVYDSAYYAVDPRKERDTVALAAVQNGEQAQKLMRIRLNRSRFQGEFSATFSYKAMKARNWSIVKLTIPEMGWTDRLFRVISFGLSATGGCDLVLREESASVYTGGTITTVPAPSQGVGADPYLEIEVGPLTVTPVTVTGAAGSAADGMKVSYATPHALTAYTDLLYKASADAAWTTMRVPVDQNAPVVQPLQPNTDYDFRVRHVSVYNVEGPWEDYTTATNDTTVQTTDRVVYPDAGPGQPATPVTDLRPAEAGADVTSNHTALDTAYVAGKAADEILADADAAAEALINDMLNRSEQEETFRRLNWSEHRARVTAEEAIVVAIDGIGVTVGGHTVSIASQAVLIGNLEQVYGTLGFIVNTDGNIASMALYAGSGLTTFSGVKFEVDEFIIKSGALSGIAPFYYDAVAGKLVLQDVLANAIQAGSISGAEINAEAELVVGTGSDSVHIKGVGDYRIFFGDDPLTANFSVTKEGHMVFSSYEQRLSDGTVWMTSDGGLTAAAITAIFSSQAGGTNFIPVVSGSVRNLSAAPSTAGNTDQPAINTFEARLGADSNVSMVLSMPLGGFDTTDTFPSTITLKLMQGFRATDIVAWGNWTQVGTLTLTKIFSGVPSSVQYLVEIETFSYWNYGATEPTFYNAYTITSPTTINLSVAVAAKLEGYYRYCVQGPTTYPFHPLSWSSNITLTDEDDNPSFILGLGADQSVNIAHPIGYYRGISASQLGTGQTSFSITTDLAILYSTSGIPRTIRNHTNTAVSISGAYGAGGHLDVAGITGANRWLHVWLISDGTTDDYLLSRSPAYPIMPSGFSYRMHVGAIRLNAAGTGIAPFTQQDDEFTFEFYSTWSGTTQTIVDALPEVFSGTQGNNNSPPVWANKSVVSGSYDVGSVPEIGLTPSNAYSVSVRIMGVGSNDIAVANGPYYGRYGPADDRARPPVHLNWSGTVVADFNLVDTFLYCRATHGSHRVDLLSFRMKLG